MIHIKRSRNTIQRRISVLSFEPTDVDDSQITGSLVTGDHLVGDDEIGKGTQ